MSWNPNDDPHYQTPEPDPTHSTEQSPSVPPAPPAQSPEPPRRKRSASRGCLVALLALIGVGVLMMLSMLLVMATGVMQMVAGGTPGGQHTVGSVTIVETRVSGDMSAPKIALIPVSGLLIRDDSGDVVEELDAMLRFAASDEDVKAIVLEVDSGGGTANAADLMREALLDFKERSKKPVVVLMGSIAASGAYYLSVAADEIMAQPTTLAGSIGVLMPLYDVTKLMQHIGIQDQTVTSGDRKQMLSPTRARTPEQTERLQSIVDQLHARFVEIVAEGRPNMEVADVEPLATGDVFTADEALENGLVDGIGYLDDAVASAASKAGLGASQSLQVVRYNRLVSLMDLFLTKVEGPTVKVEVSDDMAAHLSHEPLYLWSPGTER